MNDQRHKCKITKIRALKDKSRILLKCITKESNLNCGVRELFHEVVKLELR